MRKSALLVLALLSSCLRGPVGPATHRDSTYKAVVTVKVDTSPLHPKEEEKPADGSGSGSGSGSSAEKPKKHKVELQSAEKVVDLLDFQPTFISSDDDTAEIRWSGTAWVAATGPGRTFAMTAGHVCESDKVYHVRYIDWSTWTIKEASLPIISVEHKLVAADGTEFTNAKVIRDEDLDEHFNGIDLCLLAVAGDLGDPLPIASSDPSYSRPAWVVGAPRGIWGGGIAPTALLTYSGRGNIFGTKDEGLAFTGPAAPGNSGSAIMVDGRVVGLLNLGSTIFPMHTAVPHEELVSFLRRALHRPIF